MTTIDIHLVTYNSAATIDTAIAAALAQTGAAYTLRVWDNDSRDDTVAIARRHGVEVIAAPHNTGYTGGHNGLIARSQADLILTLNPDVSLEPGYLAALVHAFEGDPRLGSIAGCLLRVESLDAPPTAIDGVGLYMRPSRRQGLILDGAPIAQRPRAPFPIFGPDGAAACYRRAMLDDIAIDGEIFDEDFFMHKEDVDICWRAQLRGWHAIHLPTATARHVRHFRPGGRANVSPYMRFLGVRNRYLMMLKNEISSLFRRDLAAIAPYDAGIVGYLLLRERASLGALPSAWRLRARMLAKRRVIQLRRTVDAEAIARWFTGAPPL